MDTRVLANLLKIAEEKSITRAAEKLYLTQSALNQQLLRVERELGTELFTRGKYRCTPTRAGEIFLEGARRMLAIKQETFSRISDLTGTFKGVLAVGVTPVRGPDMFVHVYPAFYQQHPNLSLVPHILSVAEQQERLRTGQLDMGFMALFKSQRDENQYLDLYEEEIVLAIPQNWDLSSLGMHRQPDTGRLAFSLEKLKDRPMVLLNRGTTMRPVLDRLFAKCGVTPKVLFEAVNPTTILDMVRTGLCCGFVAEASAAAYGQGIQYLSLEKPLRWDVAAAFPKGARISRVEREFVKAAREYWKENALM